jgi:hypothetical protein
MAYQRRVKISHQRPLIGSVERQNIPRITVSLFKMSYMDGLKSSRYPMRVSGLSWLYHGLVVGSGLGGMVARELSVKPIFEKTMLEGASQAESKNCEHYTNSRLYFDSWTAFTKLAPQRVRLAACWAFGGSEASQLTSFFPVRRRELTTLTYRITIR